MSGLKMWNMFECLKATVRRYGIHVPIIGIESNWVEFIISIKVPLAEI